MRRNWKSLAASCLAMLAVAAAVHASPALAA
jgi:hypothetical protein